MNILQKIRNQSEKTRKVILWVIVIIFGLILFFFWIKNVQSKLESFQKEEFKEKLNLPKLEVPKIEMPKFEMPEFSEEELKKLEETMGETE
ncbi:MAG: hypothetical protein NT012_01450 [Candidatus Nealsonbacteria bacterium]|jgi:uncharacterized membrane protein|nr:hypothetical protein [Candidatus Nealsonbacteria bacterium]